MSSSFFLFNSKIYLQKDELGMGLPLAPIFANLFLSHHEERWLSNCPIDFKPKLYRRYVDDVCVIFNHRSHLPKCLEFMNSLHDNMKFTSELETDGSFSFLDSTNHRKPNSLSTSVYRKPTFSGLGLSFFSFIPKRFKMNCISTFLHRAYVICFTNLFMHI